MPSSYLMSYYDTDRFCLANGYSSTCTMCDASRGFYVTGKCGNTGSEDNHVDRTCGMCVAEDNFISFSNPNSPEECLPCKTCSDGQHETRGCVLRTEYTIKTSGTDRLCEACPSGYYCPDKKNKVVCSNGYDCSTVALRTSQSVCPSNYFCTNGESSGTKTQCETAKGQICEGTGLSTYTSGCSQGFKLNSVKNGCTPVDKGYYAPPDSGKTYWLSTSENSHGIRPCPKGSFSSEDGSTACTLCEPGYFSSNEASTVCSFCSSGKYSETSGSTSCLECAMGKYSFLENVPLSACTNCDGGTYQSSQGQTFCMDCSKSTYQNSEGMSSCLNCPSDTTYYNSDTFEYLTKNDDVKNCLKCIAGKYICLSNCTEIACLNCTENHFCLEGQTPRPLTQPEIGITYMSKVGDATRDNEIQNCKVCGSEEYISRNCSLNTNRACSLCKKPTLFQTYILHQCSQYADAVLADCNISSGHYLPGRECNRCPPGSILNNSQCERCPKNTIQSGNACEACPSGTFSAYGSTLCSSIENMQLHNDQILFVKPNTEWYDDERSISRFDTAISVHGGGFLGIKNFGGIGGLIYFVKENLGYLAGGNPYFLNDLYIKSYGKRTQNTFLQINDISKDFYSEYSFLIIERQMDISMNGRGSVRRLIFNPNENCIENSFEMQIVENKYVSSIFRFAHPSSILSTQNGNTWISDKNLRAIYYAKVSKRSHEMQLLKIFGNNVAWTRSPTTPLVTNVLRAPTKLLYVVTNQRGFNNSIIRSQKDVLVLDSNVIWSFSLQEYNDTFMNVSEPFLNDSFVAEARTLKYVCGSMQHGSISTESDYCYKLGFENMEQTDISVLNNMIFILMRSTQLETKVVKLNYNPDIELEQRKYVQWHLITVSDKYKDLSNSILNGFVRQSSLMNEKMWMIESQNNEININKGVSVLDVGYSNHLCEAGFFFDDIIKVCVQTPVGFFTNSWSIDFSACPKGTYGAKAGLTGIQGCVQCPTDDFDTYQDGSLNCVSKTELYCNNGTFYDSGSETCVISCDANQGLYYNGSYCTYCPIGSKVVPNYVWNSIVFSYPCEKCPAGQYGKSPGVCEPCPDGFSSVFEGSTTCYDKGVKRNDGIPLNSDFLDLSGNVVSMSSTSNGVLYASSGDSIWKHYFVEHNKTFVREMIGTTNNSIYSNTMFTFETPSPLMEPFVLFEVTDDEQYVYFAEKYGTCIWRADLLSNIKVLSPQDFYCGLCNDKPNDFNGDRFTSRFNSITDMAIMNNYEIGNVLFVSTMSNTGCLSIRKVTLANGRVDTLVSYAQGLFQSIFLGSCLTGSFSLSTSRNFKMLYVLHGNAVYQIDFLKQPNGEITVFKNDWDQSIVLSSGNANQSFKGICSVDNNILFAYIEETMDSKYKIYKYDNFDQAHKVLVSTSNYSFIPAEFYGHPMACAGQRIWHALKSNMSKNNTQINMVSYQSLSQLICLGGYVEFNNTCVQVGVGTYSDLSQNRNSGIDCKSGTYNPKGGSHSISYCINCPPGSISIPSAFLCKSCFNSQSITTDGTNCLSSCPAGFYKINNVVQNGINCVQCPLGHSSHENSIGVQSCTMCEEGFYANENTSYTCQRCPLGFTSIAGSHYCTISCGDNFCSLDGSTCSSMQTEYETITSLTLSTSPLFLRSDEYNGVFYSDMNGNNLKYFVDDCPEYFTKNEAQTCDIVSKQLLPECGPNCQRMGHRFLSGMIIENAVQNSGVYQLKYAYLVSRNIHKIYKIPLYYYRGVLDTEYTRQIFLKNEEGWTGLEKWSFCGTGIQGFQDGPCSNAKFDRIADIDISKDDSFLVVSEHGNVRIRHIHLATKQISTILGNGANCWKEGFIPTDQDTKDTICRNTNPQASLGRVQGITIDTNNIVYVAMWNANSIGKYSADETVIQRKFEKICSLNMGDETSSLTKMACQTSVETKSCFLYFPYDITVLENQLYVAVTNGILKINMASINQECEQVGGSFWSGFNKKGFADGIYNESEYDLPFRMSISKKKSVIYQAEYNNKAVRRIMLKSICKCPNGYIYIPSSKTCYNPLQFQQNKGSFLCPNGKFALEGESVCRDCSESEAFGLNVAACILYKNTLNAMNKNLPGFSYQRVIQNPFPFIHTKISDWYGSPQMVTNPKFDDMYSSNSVVSYKLGKLEGKAPYGKNYHTYTYRNKDRCILSDIQSDSSGCWVLETKTHLKPQIILPGFWFPCYNAFENNNLQSIEEGDEISNICDWKIGLFDDPLLLSQCGKKPTWNCLRLAAVEKNGLSMGSNNALTSKFERYVFRDDSTIIEKSKIKQWSRYFIFGSSEDNGKACKTSENGPCFPTFQHIQETEPENFDNFRSNVNYNVKLIPRDFEWNEKNVKVMESYVGWPSHHYCANGYMWVGPNTSIVQNTNMKVNMGPLGVRSIITCISCLSGTYSDVSLSEKLIKGGPYECMKCGGGTFSSGIGETSCKICPENTYGIEMYGSTTCLSCPRNHYSLAGSWSNFSCLPCAPGTGNCKDCTYGYYQDQSAQSICKLCSAGKYSSKLNSTNCTDCSQNTYQNEKGREKCISCPSGKFTINEGSTACLECSEASFTNCSLSIGNECGRGCGFNFYYNVSNEQCRRCPPNTLNAMDSCSKSITNCLTGSSHGKYVILSRNFTEGGDIIGECPQGTGSNEGTNYTCYGCIAGKYSAGGQDCVDCPVGSFSNTTQSSFCFFCPEGTYNDAEGASSCKNCSAGDYQDVYGSTFCKGCIPGFYSLGSRNVICTGCTNGTYSDQSKRTSVCSNQCDGTRREYSGIGATACTICELGLVNQLKCTGCGKGKYYDEEVGAEYGTCKYCPEGKFNDYNDTAFSVDVCKLCPQPYLIAPRSNEGLLCTPARVGYIRDPNNPSKIVACDTGKYRGINDTDCVSCEEGKFNNLLGAESCKLCHKGFYASSRGSLWCASCPSGKYTNKNGTVNCDNCLPGQISNKTDCIPCPANTYQRGDTCMQCEYKKHSPVGSSNESFCRECGENYYSNGIRCELCPAGKYRTGNDYLQHHCATCPPGTINPLSGEVSASSCVSCNGNGQSGYISAPNRTTCIKCEKGKMAVNDVCEACKPGWFSSEGIVCEPCQPGYYNAYEGQSLCMGCEQGKFNNMMNNTMCFPCPVGFYNNQSNQSLCKVCTLDLGFSSSVGNRVCSVRRKSCNPGSFLVMKTGSSEDNACQSCRPCKVDEFVNIFNTQYLFNGSESMESGFLEMYCPGDSFDPGFTCLSAKIEAGFFYKINSFVLSGQVQNNLEIGTRIPTISLESCNQIDNIMSESGYENIKSLVGYVSGPYKQTCYVGCKYGIQSDGLIKYINDFGTSDYEKPYENIFFTNMLPYASKVCKACPLTPCSTPGKYRPRDTEYEQCGPPCSLNSFVDIELCKTFPDGCIRNCRNPPANSSILAGSSDLGNYVCPFLCHLGFFLNDNNTACLSCKTDIKCGLNEISLKEEECLPNHKMKDLCKSCPIIEGGKGDMYSLSAEKCLYQCFQGYYPNKDNTDCLACNATLPSCPYGQYRDLDMCVQNGLAPLCKNCTSNPQDKYHLLSFYSDGGYSASACFANCKNGYNAKNISDGSLVNLENSKVFSSEIFCDICNSDEGVSCQGNCFMGQYKNLSFGSTEFGRCKSCKQHHECGTGKYAAPCNGNETADSVCLPCEESLLYSARLKSRIFVPYENSNTRCPTTCDINFVEYQGECILCSEYVQKENCKEVTHTEPGQPKPCDFIYSHYNASVDSMWWKEMYTPLFMKGFIPKPYSSKIVRKGKCWACPIGSMTRPGDKDLCQIIPGYGIPFEKATVQIVNVIETNEIYTIKSLTKKPYLSNSSKIQKLAGRRLLQVNGRSNFSSSLVLSNFSITDLISCPYGTYKNDSSFSQCRECPLGSNTIKMGSTTITDCLCIPGFYRNISSSEINNFYWNGSYYSGKNLSVVNNLYKIKIHSTNCIECPVDTYRQFGMQELKCQACPANETTNNLLGSTNCVCKLGYHRVKNQCVLCPANFFCVPCYINETIKCPPGDAHVLPCFFNSTSKPGSFSSSNCTCINSSQLIVRNSMVPLDNDIVSENTRLKNVYCSTAPPNTEYDPLHKKFKCKRGWNDVKNEKNEITGCYLCSLGEFAHYDPSELQIVNGTLKSMNLTCSKCPKGFYSDSTITIGKCKKCPASLTTNVIGADDMKKCGCPIPQYLSKNGSVCLGCLENQFYNKSINGCQNCPSNSVIIEPIHGSVKDCQCKQGFYPTFAKNSYEINGCAPCEQGKYKITIGNSNCTQCLFGKTTEVTGSSSRNCVCDTSKNFLNIGGQCVKDVYVQK